MGCRCRFVSMWKSISLVARCAADTQLPASVEEHRSQGGETRAKKQVPSRAHVRRLIATIGAELQVVIEELAIEVGLAGYGVDRSGPAEEEVQRRVTSSKYGQCHPDGRRPFGSVFHRNIDQPIVLVFGGELRASQHIAGGIGQIQTIERWRLLLLEAIRLELYGVDGPVQGAAPG